jgi:hypothetical protein
MVIKTSNKNISNIAGQKSSNIDYFKEKFKFKKIQIFESAIDKNLIDVTIGDFYDRIDLDIVMSEFIKSYR